MDYIKELIYTLEQRLEDLNYGRNKVIDAYKNSDNIMKEVYSMERIKYEVSIQEIEGVLDYIYLITEE